MAFDEHPLWKFSLAVYGAPGVAPACLDLQDRRGADVNLILYLAFVALSGRGRLGADEIAACRAALAPWADQVVGRLRQVRRALKPGSGADFGPDLAAVGAEPVAALRRQVATLEIAAEQVAQQALAGRLAALPVAGAPGVVAGVVADRRAAALANIRAYLASLPAPDPAPDLAADEAALAAIAAAFPDTI
jgi:uncharacterized protein (TIGR02444 family)